MIRAYLIFNSSNLQTARRRMSVWGPSRVRRRLFSIVSRHGNRLFVFALFIISGVLFLRLTSDHRSNQHQFVTSSFGEKGSAVNLDPDSLTSGERAKYDDGWKTHQFNEYVSDLIGEYRTLPDHRRKECTQQPSKPLPQVSVIICFHNEAWSTLIRSVSSVLKRTDRKLLRKVILIDDASDLEHLGKKLEDFVESVPLLKLVRSTKRIGLIKARLLGYRIATAPVLVFLDSHVECTAGWLEHLLAPIAENPTTVTFPVVDVIDRKTFEYKVDPAHVHNVGGFNWGLEFSWHPLPKRDNMSRKNEADPMRSPTMPGGLFAIDREFFERIGTYDEGLEIWGGENLELSFKIWMCGGQLLMIACSRVGHVFRMESPYKWGESSDDILGKNLGRVAEVWLDEYKRYFYERNNDKPTDLGTLLDRIALRKTLNCHSFDWYIQNVYPEIFIPDRGSAWGEVRNLAFDGTYCLDGRTDEESAGIVGIYPCHGTGGNQFWSLTEQYQLRRDDYCVASRNGNVHFVKCHTTVGDTTWEHETSSQQLRPRGTAVCLTAVKNQMMTRLEQCDENVLAQRWKFKNYRSRK